MPALVSRAAPDWRGRLIQLEPVGGGFVKRYVLVLFSSDDGVDYHASRSLTCLCSAFFLALLWRALARAPSQFRCSISLMS